MLAADNVSLKKRRKINVSGEGEEVQEKEAESLSRDNKIYNNLMFIRFLQFSWNFCFSF